VLVLVLVRSWKLEVAGFWFLVKRGRSEAVKRETETGNRGQVIIITKVEG